MKPWFFAAGIETLVTLVIFIAISALSTWLKSRNPENTDESLPPPRIPRRSEQNRPAQPAREAKPVSWEEELRRLLENETPATPPAKPIPAEHRTFAPPPLPPVVPVLPPASLRRRVVAEEAETADDGGLAVDMPTLSRAESSQTYASQIDDRAGEKLRQGGAFAKANASFTRASQLHELTAARMRHVTEQTPAMMAVTTRVGRTSEGVRVSAMLRNPESVRTAIVASVILGKPKAMES